MRKSMKKLKTNKYTKSAVQACKEDLQEKVIELAQKRDELRTMVEEYRDILDTVDDAFDCFDDGLEEMSRYI